METPQPLPRVGVIGRGRLGPAMADALRRGGIDVMGPLGRDWRAAIGERIGVATRRSSPSRAEPETAFLLCVPDSELAAVADALPTGAVTGHCSGASGLDVLGPREAFSLHPLMTVPRQGRTDFSGVACAVAGTSPRARALALELAERAGMVAIEIAEHDRGAYHAAASVASNFLVTLEDWAERLALSAGAGREQLAPLVRATVENWAATGAQALTGPIARGDRETVARQRRAVAERTPELTDLFEALVQATSALARRGAPGAPVARRASSGGRSGITTVRTVADLRATLAPARRAGARIGLVATMGALHEGHLSLIRRAREQCDEVVVSLFVNPAQFGDGEDLEAYPRDEARDRELAAAAGANLVFAPPVDEVYPDGFATTVAVAPLARALCGAHRGPEHFQAVATVVSKLLNMVAPTVAYFGQKDAQQALIIRRLVTDLNLPVRIEVCPTVREADGLALSSRNAYLDEDERRRAGGLSAALRAAETLVARGERDPGRVAQGARAVLAEYGLVPEYLELVSPVTLAPVRAVEGEVLVAVAAVVGRARLIDNVILSAPPAGPPSETSHPSQNGARQPCNA